MDPVRPFDRFDEQAGHLTAHLLDWLTDARKWRMRGRSDGRVVEADDRDVFRDSVTGRNEDGQRAGGHQVGCGEHGVEVRVAWRAAWSSPWSRSPG